MYLFWARMVWINQLCSNSKDGWPLVTLTDFNRSETLCSHLCSLKSIMQESSRRGIHRLVIGACALSSTVFTLNTRWDCGHTSLLNTERVEIIEVPNTVSSLSFATLASFNVYFYYFIGLQSHTTSRNFQIQVWVIQNQVKYLHFPFLSGWVVGSLWTQILVFPNTYPLSE